MAIDKYINTRNIESSPWPVSVQLDEQTLHRLADISEDGSTISKVDLLLQREARNEFRVSGQISAEVKLLCQRCLQPYTCKLNVEIDEVFTEKAPLAAVRLLNNEQVSQDNDESDYFDKEGHFCLLHYIEDEILLAVPTFPAHPDDRHCDPEMVARLQDKTIVEEVNDSPFSILKNLK